jgi:hypothetical protein
MIKKPRTSNLKKGSNTKEQKTSFLSCLQKIVITLILRIY